MIKMASYVFAMAMALVTATFFVSCGGAKHVLTTTANEGIIYCGAMIDSSKGYAVGDEGLPTAGRILQNQPVLW